MRVKIFRARRTLKVLLIGIILTIPAILAAFQEQPANTSAPREQEIEIKRDALLIRSPNRYEQHLSLAPIRSLEVPAPVDGYVRTVSMKLGGKAGKESEIIRFDDARAMLVLKAAKARLQAAQIEKKLAKDADQQALADARIEAAQADVELATLDADRLIIRAPFAGEIHAIHVVEGQFVRAGHSLLTLADVSQLKVEVPVDSRELEVGGEVSLRIGEASTSGKVDVLLPPLARFESLRDLTDTLQTAIIVFPNDAGKFAAGQSAYCELIPREPVTKVATLAVKNRPDGTRKVQVLRNHIVRDITVQIHSKVGTESVFVSGAFREGDELISRSSMDLADGTPVRELLAQSESDPGNRAGQAAKPKPAATEGF